MTIVAPFGSSKEYQATKPDGGMMPAAKPLFVRAAKEMRKSDRIFIDVPLLSFRFLVVGFRPVGTNEEGGRNNSGHGPGSSLRKWEAETAGSNLKASQLL
jgi:hypothetical protein